MVNCMHADNIGSTDVFLSYNALNKKTSKYMNAWIVNSVMYPEPCNKYVAIVDINFLENILSVSIRKTIRTKTQICLGEFPDKECYVLVKLLQ